MRGRGPYLKPWPWWVRVCEWKKTGRGGVLLWRVARRKSFRVCPHVSRPAASLFISLSSHLQRPRLAPHIISPSHTPPSYLTLPLRPSSPAASRGAPPPPPRSASELATAERRVPARSPARRLSRLLPWLTRPSTWPPPWRWPRRLPAPQVRWVEAGREGMGERKAGARLSRPFPSHISRSTFAPSPSPPRRPHLCRLPPLPRRRRPRGRV